ncbi:MAG: ATP-binding protein, partial [Fervidobacterium sp.]
FEILKEKEPVSFVAKYLKNLGQYISFSINLQHISFNFSSKLDEEFLLNECYNLLSSLSKT